jgi:hypothetical protein
MQSTADEPGLLEAELGVAAEVFAPCAHSLVEARQQQLGRRRAENSALQAARWAPTVIFEKDNARVRQRRLSLQKV